MVNDQCSDCCQWSTEQVLRSSVGSSGILTSPNYPLEYPSDADCQWMIVGGPGKIITVSFVTFHLETDTTCDYDVLQAYEGRGINGRKIFE